MKILILLTTLLMSTNLWALNALNLGFIANDPTFDNTPVLNQLIANIGPERTLYFPHGTYHFNSKPSVINKNMVFIGDGINGTSFRRNYTPSHYSDALIHATATISIEKMAILAGNDTKGGGALKLETRAASSSVLRDLYISAKSGSNWAIPLTLTSTDTLGIRGVRIDNVELFAATIHIAWFVNVRGLSADFNAYNAGGTSSQVVIQGSNGMRSQSIQLKTRHLSTLYLYDTDNIKINTLGTTVNQNNSNNVIVY